MKPSFSSIAGVRGRKAIHGGFMYTKQRTGAGGWTQWECVKRKSGCKGRLKINQDESECEHLKAHNHIANFGWN